MNLVSVIMAAFAVLGLLDRLLGNRLGLGKEFEKGFLLLGQLVLSMLGMIIIAPVLADWLSPMFAFVYDVFGIEPSIIPASLFANDMGGAPLAKEIARDPGTGMFNAMVVSSMMGATVSFTIPLSLGCLKKEKQPALILGLLAGIVTIPVGCILAGFLCGIPFLTSLLNLLPLIVFALLVGAGLLLVPGLCIKAFQVLGVLIRVLIAGGLFLGILELLVGIKPLAAAADAAEGIGICFSAALVLSGAFPLLFVLSKILARPMQALGKRLGISETATLGFVSTLANNVSTFEIMNEMDTKGAVLNAAFAVSASFVLADHLAFTLSFDATYLAPMMVAKLTSGLSALLFALLVYKKAGAKVTGEGD